MVRLDRFIKFIDHLWVIYDNLDLTAIYTDHDGISWEPYNGVD